MTQEIITYVILVATFALTIRKFLKFFSNESHYKCANCFQAHSRCNVAQLKKSTIVGHSKVPIDKIKKRRMS